MMKKYTLVTGAALAVLLLASCGSSGGLGNIFGGGTNTGNGTYATQIRGTVDSVDTSTSSIYLTNVTGNGSMLSSGGSSSSNVRVYYDNRTSVNYNGKSFRPQDLERGDQVDITVNQSGNQLYANSMNVVYNARAGNTGNTTYPNGNYPNNGSYGSTVHGTVRAIDTYRGTITVDQGYNAGTISIPTSTNTPVYYNGQTYRTSDLQVGDEIDIRMNGNSAQDITVTRSINSSSNGSYPGSSTQYSTIRGTVRSVNTSNHTIQLDSPSWISNFNRGSGTMSNTITVSYDPNTSINVNGQTHPISGLERGDVIDVQVQNNGGSSFFAQNISLVRDVRQ